MNVPETLPSEGDIRGETELPAGRSIDSERQREGPPMESAAPLEPTDSPATTGETPSSIIVQSKKPLAAEVQDGSPLRMLLHIGIGFIALFLFLRTIALEPFGVPTGSMAPALIGNHREGACPRCGYPVRVGYSSNGGSEDDQFGHIGCPNCSKRFSLADDADLNGDRLLVDKNVFNLRSPRRWEMAVFHCPDPDQKEFGKPYVKRIVGLPGEVVRIVDGDAYADDRLLRKELAEVRETRVPVFDMRYVPSPGNWSSRWLVEPAENDPRLPRAVVRPLVEADSSVVRGGVLTLDASDPAQPSAAVRYRHWNLDDRREEPIRAWSSYDGIPRAFGQLPIVHDFSICCEIEATSALPGAVFACELTDGADAVRAEIPIGSHANPIAVISQTNRESLSSSKSGMCVEVGKSYLVEFAFVDRRSSLAIDGREIVPHADLPPAFERKEVHNPVRMSAQSCRIVVRNFALYRDTHYTQYGEHGTQHSAQLGPHEFFVLGDNSGNSQDSRKWPTPGVPEADFIGKPFVIHQPLRPARIRIGGRERVFQTVDWSRLRWLH